MPEITLVTEEEFNQHLRQNISHNHYAVATGTNTLVSTISDITSLVAGLSVRFKNTTANTGAVTLNLNGLGAKPVVKSAGTALSSGNLKAGGLYTVVYDGTSFFLQGEGGEYGTATASQVLTGYTLGTESGIVSGTLTLPSKSATGVSSRTSSNTFKVTGLDFVPRQVIATVTSTASSPECYFSASTDGSVPRKINVYGTVYSTLTMSASYGEFTLTLSSGASFDTQTYTWIAKE